MPSILFILPYPLGKAPSQRFRVEQWLPILETAGYTYELCPFMDDDTWNILYKGGATHKKVLGIIKGFYRRWRSVIAAKKYDYIFIHREASPIGPPIFEWYLSKILRIKYIYDFDDAIWIPNISKENKLASYFKAYWKVSYICKWGHSIAAGNRYLAEFARQYAHKRVVIVPTVVDTNNKYNRTSYLSKQKTTVGWTGSHSTLHYLNKIVSIFKELQYNFTFEFIVIADKNPNISLDSFRFIPWSAATEIEDLSKIDIGIMPLSDDEWSEGKCGFKLIQYMALGIPAVASPVGVNKEIISHGNNGFLCDTDTDWEVALKLLLTNDLLRKQIGIAGRETVVNNFSIQSQKKKFLRLFCNY